MPWLFSVVNDRSSVPAPTPSAYSKVSRSVHSNSVGSVTAPMALGSIAITASSRSRPQGRGHSTKSFPPTPLTRQAIAMANRIRTVICKAAAVLVATMSVGACSGGTAHVRTITLTFVRHAQAENNANKVIDTTVPGPGLSHDGQDQAQRLAHQLARNGYDGVYASTMARTQQTAAPLAAELGKQVEVLPGLRE